MPIIRDILHGASHRGASLVTLCERLGITMARLNDSNEYLDFERSIQAWELAVKMTGDRLLGLHLGETTNPSILGLIGHLMQSSPTLEIAYRNVCEFSKVATDMFRYTVKNKGGTMVLGYEPSENWMIRSPDSARQAVDQAMAGTLQVFKLLSGKKISPVAGITVFKKPGTPREHERVFQGTLKFGGERNELIFEKANLQETVLGYDRSLYAMFDNLLRERMERFGKRDTFSDQVKMMITSQFKGQVPPVEVAASSLHMTPRSFQRRLQAEGESYRILSARLKKEIATDLLKHSGSKMEDIAELMGYSEASAFRRAFKSWTDTLPAKLRKSL